MARTKITEESSRAFLNWRNFKRSNTQVTVTPYLTYLHLFWNRIASYDRLFKTLYINNCWRDTVTTKERLNWILEKFNAWYIYQKNYNRYYEHKDWTIERVYNNKTIIIDLNEYQSFTFINI